MDRITACEKNLQAAIGYRDNYESKIAREDLETLVALSKCATLYQDYPCYCEDNDDGTLCTPCEIFGLLHGKKRQ